MLDIQMLNPFGERRPIVQLALAGLAYGLVALVRVHLGVPAAFLAGAMIVATLPASVAVLGLEENPFKAMSPVALGRLIGGLGAWYFVVLGTIAAYGAVTFLCWRWMPWRVLQLVGPLFAILSVVSVLAGAIYIRRDDLGIEVWHSPERRGDRLRREMLARDEHVIDSAYNQARLGAHAAAAKILVDWLASRGNRVEDYHWLCTRLGSWNDSRHLQRTTADYVDRLLRLQRNGEALDVVGNCLKALPGFRPG